MVFELLAKLETGNLRVDLGDDRLAFVVESASPVQQRLREADLQTRLPLIRGYEKAGMGIAIASDNNSIQGNYIGTDGDTSSIAALLADRGADGFISLREAITATNNTPNGASPDEIRFDIAGAGPHTILVGAGGLPTITEAVVIDGYTQTGAPSAPR